MSPVLIMKTLDQLRVLLFLCFCLIGFLLLSPREYDASHEIRRRLEFEESLIWKQKDAKSLDFKRIKWDRIMRIDERYQFDSDRVNEEEVEVDKSPDFPSQLELIDTKDEILQEIKKLSRQKVERYTAYGREGEKEKSHDGNDGRYNPEHQNQEEREVKGTSLMFKPSGLRFVIEQRALPQLQCPKDFTADRENTVFDILAHCEHQSVFPAEIDQWYHGQTAQCEGHLLIFNREMAILQDVIMDKGHSALVTRDSAHHYSDLAGPVGDSAPGGQHPYHLELGFFQIYCPSGFSSLSSAFRGGETNHLWRWYYVTEPFTNPMIVDYVTTQVTMVITRSQPDSLYHTLADLYNAYLTLRFLNLTGNEISILTLDSHWYNPLDSLWTHLFQFKVSLEMISSRTHFHTLIWNTPGYQSHFLQTNLDSLGYVEEFGDYILKRYGIHWRKPLNCRKLNILLILRRDYVNRDGEISRKISRKIDNEEELYTALHGHFKNDHVNGSQLDLLPLRLQLDHVANTDILIGAHGAGLSHGVFLPPHAAMLELFPQYWVKEHQGQGQTRGHQGHRARDQYSAICKWRGLLYDKWVNPKSEQESRVKDIMAVDVAAIVRKVENLKEIMCPFSLHKLKQET